jgi:hypothetical protein
LTTWHFSEPKLTVGVPSPSCCTSPKDDQVE